jgi:hypothetical protein
MSLASLAALLATLSAIHTPGVAFTVLEGGAPTKGWDLAAAATVDRYSDSAFALVGLPTKYSPHGIPVDRPAPFVVRADTESTLPAGEYTFVLRSRNAARLLIDGKTVVELGLPKNGTDGHEPVPPVIPPHDPNAPPLGPAQREAVAKFKLDGKPHAFRLEVIIGDQKRRVEAGDTVVAVARTGEAFRLFAPVPAVLFTSAGWSEYVSAARARLKTRDAETRLAVSANEQALWDKRHEDARRAWADKPRPRVPDVPPGGNAVDALLAAEWARDRVQPTPVIDDYAYLRRAYLDTVGVPPTAEEVAAFRADTDPDRRAKLAKRLLADPRWADHWVSYWQDVLAENPGLVKPTLNNTGPFRFWLHQALTDNLPADRFATELIRMEGSTWYGGPAGFGVATENDVPMAAKATIIARAFLAVDLQCARCHDAPRAAGDYKQAELFSFAAMLSRKPIKVPATSVVPPGPDGRTPAVRVRLKVGEVVSPAWQLDRLAPQPKGEPPRDSRERLAQIVTGPASERFPRVIANRVWTRLIGWSLVDPVDDWADSTTHFPQLLDYLTHELVASGYDMKHVARLVMTSVLYQRQSARTASGAERFSGPARRRLTAEQLLDSLFAVAGKEFDCGELTFDPEARHPVGHSPTYGVPRRAWELVGLSGERDRPSLALPRAQPLVDLMAAYGWREARAGSRTTRPEPPTALQPMVLANGVVSARIARLSDGGALTDLCLEDQLLPELVEQLVLRVLGRPPTDAEKQLFTEMLADGYADRRLKAPLNPPVAMPRPVAWSHHLRTEAAEGKLATERLVQAGDPPTRRLRADWRERAEDVVWALVNSPEFVFVP